MLDNFDRIVENLDDDGSLLRETLINYNDIQIIAGSTRMDEHFWGYDKPFYEFFRRHRLEALSREEIDLLLNHWSDSLEIPILRTFVKDNPGKIENIRLLTDGLPRTLQFFIQIVLQKSETSTYDYLKKTMDNVSPLFQERLNALTAPMRKIVLEMAFIWEACSTKQLVEKARMESKLISANLSTLVDKGIVDKIETSKKQHLYRISERFFNMWLIVTQGNPEQKRKARWLSVFLENWYDANEFKRLTGEHISKLQNGETDWYHALVFSKALSQSKYLTTDERDTIIELTEKIRCKDIRNCMVELPEKFKSIFPKIERYIDEKNYTKAIGLVKGIENEADGQKFMLLGFLFAMQKAYPEAEENCLLAIEKGAKDAIFNLALLFEDQKKFQKADMYYKLAIEAGIDEAIFSLAFSLDEREKINEAEKYYLMAVEKGYDKALNNLATVYVKLGEMDKAEAYYLSAIKKGDIKAMSNLALMYKDQGRLDEAEKYYLRAIKNNNLNAILNLAHLYDFQEKLNEAEKYYLLAIEKGDMNALNSLAGLYFRQEKYTESEKYCLLAIQTGNKMALNNLALLYNNTGKLDEAEEYYCLAIKEGVNEALFNLALLYSKQEKYDKSEHYYLLSIKKGIDKAYNNLSVLYYQTNTKKTEALEYARRVLITNNDLECNETLLIIEIWNGIFNDVENRSIEIIRDVNDKVTEELLFDLLVQQQKNLVLRLFQHPELGSKLQEKYLVLYYVTLLLSSPQDENLRLRIPPELQSTIDDVLEKIAKQQQLYASGKSLL
ncbi:tetratricopeptide repeat protein [Aquipluma nitroreducens]|uniref:tetratricopeptide repeat protein n=1 Tax=Aquipluma nitroreducens TaxID=2010828 RepID=UPI00296E4C14|nr:tetratricopeptide repeat protein [Aquipluma nitroreducens]